MLGFKKFVREQIRYNPRLERRIRNNPMVLVRMRKTYDQKVKVNPIAKSKVGSSGGGFPIQLPAISYKGLKNSITEANQFLNTFQEMAQTADGFRKMFNIQDGSSSNASAMLKKYLHNNNNQ